MKVRRDAAIRELERIADEQTALRRVTALVAHGAPPPLVFEAVTAELGRLLDVQCSVLSRYETGGTDGTGEPMIRVVASWSAGGTPDVAPVVGSRWGIRGTAAERILRSGRSERVCYDAATSGIAIWARSQNIRYGVGSPITVAGRLWGVSAILSCRPVPHLADIETRMAQFVELVTVAIETAENRHELVASRDRIVEAADSARRCIERDLHDGAQQHLISLGLGLRLIEDSVSEEYGELREQIANLAETARTIHDEVREIARGVYPSILTRRGLAAALKTLAIRSSIPVELNVHDDRRLAERVEVTVYYVVSEALTNAAKYSGASEVCVDLVVHDTRLCLSVRDDGAGGAVPGRGSGLVGLTDRVAALDGSFAMTSPPGQGTRIVIEIPIRTP